MLTHKSLSLWCSLILLIACATVINGFVQQLYLYPKENANEEQQITVYQQNVPTFTLPTGTTSINYYCAVGWWFCYSDANYKTFLKAFGSATGQLVCKKEVFNCLSFRYAGDLESTNDVIVLHPEEKYQGATPIRVVGGGHEVNSTESVGISADKTGPSDWILYRDRNFSGPSVCFKGSSSNFNFTRNVNSLGLISVGSVLKRNCTWGATN